MASGWASALIARESQISNLKSQIADLLVALIEDRVKQEISMMPLGIVGNLSPEQLADLIAYLESLH